MRGEKVKAYLDIIIISSRIRLYRVGLVSSESGYARVAQLAERSIRNAEVVGSTPTEGFSQSLSD